MTGYTVTKWYHNEELKLVAAASMLIDHIGAVLIENTSLYQNESWTIAAVICRLIGRVAFPLFCFLLVEGFLHTSDRKKYILRMGLFTLISEVPFDLALFGRITLYRQNVFFTLFIGLLFLTAVEKVGTKTANPVYRASIQGLLTVLACGACFFLLTDYSYMGILLIAAFYFFRNEPKKKCIVGGVLFLYELTSIFAFVMIYRYSGKKGESKIPKQAFYWFYPLHLLVLWGIRYMACGY